MFFSGGLPTALLASRQGHAAVRRERALKAEVVYFLITSLEEEFCATADFFFFF